MEAWTSAGSSVSGVYFDHVAVAAWNILNGADGSIPTSFAADAPIKYSYIGDISANTLIQDKSKLTAVALLIDRVSGNVVNAAQSAIGDYTAAISSVNAAAAAAERYSVDGRRLPAPQKGLNIIKTADGKVRKVIVR